MKRKTKLTTSYGFWSLGKKKKNKVEEHLRTLAFGEAGTASPVV